MSPAYDAGTSPSEWGRKADADLWDGALAQNALQLHGDAHVAFDLELAGHERRHAVELAVDHVVEVAERHVERAVGRLVVVADGRRVGVAVDIDDALIGGEFHGVAEGRL